LSYLSFEDKIRFECVSKQFQRYLYNKQNSLEIDEYYARRKYKSNVLLINIAQNNRFNYKAFGSVLKKCKFIININFNGIKTQELIKLIIKYCIHLKSIAFDFNEISDELIEKFGLKFG
jgi:hypothetical protein